MTLRHHEIDSRALGRPVLEILELPASGDLADFEAQYLREYDPAYVFCRVPADELGTIQRLEQFGLRFIEFQVQSELTLRKRYAVDAYPYEYRPVETPEALEAVLQIAEAGFADNRFTVDPELPQSPGRERYRRYVQKSFEDPQELLHQLINPQTSETVGFNSCRLLSDEQVQLYLAAVQPKYRATGLGTILNYFVFNDLLERGVKRILTHQSGRNHAILNVELGHFGFRVRETFVVLRKLYPE